MADNGEQGKPTVVAIVGPTCAGKTQLSLELAALFRAEIIACDCRTVYKFLDIGTAKPSHEERERIPHHLIDVVTPDMTYTVAEYCQQAAEAIAYLQKRSCLPIVCGGTGFYARALLQGLSIPAVPPQPDLRAQLNKLADKEGNEHLYQQLRTLDPQAALGLSVNDRFRIIRRLEVSLVCGKPFSELASTIAPPYRTIWIGIATGNRSFLHTAIRQRFKQQISAGLLGEVEYLLQRYGASQTIVNTVNYKELAQYLAGKIDRETAYEAAIRHNCQLAKRQLIWFNANSAIKWFFTDELHRSELKKAICEHLHIQLQKTN